MSTQFFERQEAQKTYTRWLVWAFIAAIVAVVLVINLIVLIGLGGHPVRTVSEEPMFVFWTSMIVLGVIFGAWWHKSSEMRSGGAAVARAVGGQPVTAGDGDLKRQRLLNIVEEMAIAARIRKPQVFVLPEETGINAFAAGHSPDEAAVAVTQGALDKLDRDQLQAVIGHEFSHILNGDMKINMRLTAWVFGLLVITDLAGRVMRGRSRGKAAARIKAIAFGVFLAGSIGMFAGRLLQAAVSRRREHLADASAVQFTRNPAALQQAFIIMAASAEGTAIEHSSSTDMAHMFFAGSASGWMAKFGGWFSTHPPIEERVRALDSRVTKSRFKSLVSEERRKIFARMEQEAAGSEATGQPAPAPATAELDMPAAMLAQPVPLEAHRNPVAGIAAAGNADGGDAGGLSLAATIQTQALPAALPPGVRMIAGRALPPDVLRNRLSEDQQAGIADYLSSIEDSSLAVQGTYVAAMLASEPAKWRTQLTKLAPVLGIELFKETQAQIPRIAALVPAARLPLLTDLLPLLDAMDPAHRKRLRGVARAFSPTVAQGDMLRYSLTRILERKLARPVQEPPPVALPERAPQVGEIYATLAHCRFGAGKQGLNAYRAGLMGMLPPQKWLPFPEAPLAPAALDAAITGVAQIDPTGKRAFSEGLARVIAVGGRLTVRQVDLLRGICMLVDCQVPVLPPDVVYEDAQAELAPPAARSAQVKAR
ncbi:MAG TPA: M48 family metallopeptidase [Steroidobacteraceae bacterium]|nr:M48 family metallopeptidase [Steroidobacteraceae bacterium]